MWSHLHSGLLNKGIQNHADFNKMMETFLRSEKLKRDVPPNVPYLITQGNLSNWNYFSLIQFSVYSILVEILFFQRERIDCPLFHSNWNKWSPSRIFTPKLYSQWLMQSKLLTPSPDCDVLNCCKYSLKYFISKDPLISIKVINSFKHIWT